MREVRVISTRVRCALAVCMVMAVATLARCQQGDDLLAVLKAGHRATRESIRTLSASMVIEQEFPGKGREDTFKCTYWRTPTAVRCRQFVPGGSIEDVLRTPSEQKQVGKHPNPNGKGFQYGASRAPLGKGRIPADVWSNMLIDFPNGSGGDCDLDRFLETATKPPVVKKERLDGRDCLRLTSYYNDAQSGETRLDAWFDPAVNYLVRKRVVSRAKMRSESWIQSFRRIGEWMFPEVCVGEMFTAGKSSGRAYATLTDVKVNTPLPEGILRLPVPNGTILFDEFDNTRYHVNERWERIGARTNTPAVKSLRPASDGDAPFFTEQSRSEPPARTQWLLWVSLGLLGVGASVWGWRNRGRLRWPPK